MIFVVARIILGGFGLNARAAWTIVNFLHAVISFVLFHIIKGSPIVQDHGEYGELTVWEQIDDQMQFTDARKFLTIFPIALFLVCCNAANWDSLTLAYFWLNFIPAAIVVVPKLPFMHKVRLFGINA